MAIRAGVSRVWFLRLMQASGASLGFEALYKSSRELIWDSSAFLALQNLTWPYEGLLFLIWGSDVGTHGGLFGQAAAYADSRYLI